LAAVIRQTRTLTFELYPSMLGQLGLTTTLRHYAEQLSAHSGARVVVLESGPQAAPGEPDDGFLFRAVKELVGNALKHGAAREIVVQIRRRRAHVRILVQDDGKGFDPSGTVGTGLG